MTNIREIERNQLNLSVSKIFSAEQLGKFEEVKPWVKALWVEERREC